MNNRTCLTCEESYQPTHGRQRYCGPDCKPSNHPKVTVPCAACGEPCQKEPSQLKKFNGAYCSYPCRDRHMKANKRGVWAKEPKPRVVRPARDLRSALRRAVEDGTGQDILTAVHARCHTNDRGCWEWQGRNKDGYAEATIGKRYVQVHRLTLEAHTGLTLGKQAAHHVCANSICVNPTHLQPVTHAENNAEMMARTYMVQRIQELEEALQMIDPKHPLLIEVSVPRVSAA